MPKSIRVREIPRSGKAFYVLFGPVFGSRKIAKEVGVHAYDDEDKQWVSAFDGGKMVGWCSVRGRVISDCYVMPEYRSRGVFAKLLSHVVRAYPTPLRATCTNASLGVFRKAGFKPVRKTTNYTVMELGDA
jgi:GNAT superfamily N-acetyltransferase